MSAPAAPRPNRLPTEPVLEVTLALLTVAVGLGFSRLFIGWGFVPRVLLPALTVHAVGATTRRLRVPTVAAVLLGLFGALCVWTTMCLPGSGWGPIPTATTVDRLISEAREAFRPFSSLIAPVPAHVGFVAVASLSVLACAVYADAAAFRGRVPVQAMTCHVGVFLFCGVLARGPRQTLAAGAFTAAAALHLVVVHADSVGRQRWRSGDRFGGTRRLAASGGLAVVLLGLVAAWPYSALPAAGEARIDLRNLNRDRDPRRLVSPLVSVRNTIEDQHDTVMFRVSSADGPHYWRLTALDQLSGDVWTASSDVTWTRPGSPGTAENPGGTVSRRFVIEGLAGIWLPVAHKVVGATADFPLAVDEASGTLITRRPDGVARGQRYTAWSTQVAYGDGTARVPATLTEFPADLSSEVRSLAVAHGAGPDDLSRLRALQDWLRTFEYSTDVDYSRADDPTAAFLAARKGYCQQFASTFAVMARTLGYPTRVAVGFTYGNQDPQTGDFIVFGKHAHAWPEVWLSGLGWVAFEPTPGRGDPTTTDVTGVPGAQDDSPVGGVGTTPETVPRPRPSGASAAPTTTTRPRRETPPPTTKKDSGGGATLIAGVAFVAVAVAGAVWARLALVRRRRRPPEDDPTAAVDVAWANTLDDLRHAGITPHPSDTVAGFAASHRGDAPAALLPLAALVERRLFAPEPPTAADAAAAVQASTDVEADVVARLSRFERGRRELGLTPRARRRTPTPPESAT